jgi:hypothetical protein
MTTAETENGPLTWRSWEMPSGDVQRTWVSGNDRAVAGGLARENIDAGAHLSVGQTEAHNSVCGDLIRKADNRFDAHMDRVK